MAAVDSKMIAKIRTPYVKFINDERRGLSTNYAVITISRRQHIIFFPSAQNTWTDMQWVLFFNRARSTKGDEPLKMP